MPPSRHEYQRSKTSSTHAAVCETPRKRSRGPATISRIEDNSINAIASPSASPTASRRRHVPTLDISGRKEIEDEEKLRLELTARAQQAYGAAKHDASESYIPELVKLQLRRFKLSREIRKLKEEKEQKIMELQHSESSQMYIVLRQMLQYSRHAVIGTPVRDRYASLSTQQWAYLRGKNDKEVEERFNLSPSARALLQRSPQQGEMLKAANPDISRESCRDAIKKLDLTDNERGSYEELVRVVFGGEPHESTRDSSRKAHR